MRELRLALEHHMKQMAKLKFRSLNSENFFLIH